MSRRLTVFGLLLAALGVGIGWLNHHISRFDHIISQAAARNGVDFDLVKALIFEESWFQPDIMGPAGEIGLMQITPAAAADFSSRRGLPPLYQARLFEPELNAEIGCWYLRQSLERYKHSPAPTVFALLRYNAGEVRTDHWLRLALTKSVPVGMPAERYYLSLVDYPKTREYVRRILHRAESRNFWF
ncbi:MAG TPA: transglycosylase SLT domain-containing protein [Acidobacteriota bacterium]|nr:transglycosylase SLT domain-containing protein [Acidobacteriota bacterium]